MEETKFVGNPAISDPVIHKQVVDMFNRIVAQGENKKWEWEVVPIEEDEGIPEYYNIIWDSEEFYSDYDKGKGKILFNGSDEPWISKEIDSLGFKTFVPRLFSSKKLYKQYLEDRAYYREQLTPFIKCYATVASALYNKKLLDIKEYKFKTFEEVLAFVKSAHETKDIILYKFDYKFFDVISQQNRENFNYLGEQTLETPKISFNFCFAFVDK